ncbi:MAG: hypothetical protein ACRDAO_03575 [Culicoidibacterales bacterium]
MRKSYRRSIAGVIIIGIVIGAISFQWYTKQEVKQWPLTVQDTMNAQQLRTFVTTQLMNNEGGVYTNYLDIPIEPEDVITQGHAILSESQGLLLEYARLMEDEKLFFDTWAYTKTHFQLPSGFFRWRIDDDFTNQTQFTATIDDLKIIEQLILACEQWPEQANILQPSIELFAKNFITYASYNEFMNNGYDFAQDAKSSELDTSYVHLQGLALLQQQHIADQAAIETMKIQSEAFIEQSYLGDEFPFYRQRLLLDTLSIQTKPTINMIESLLVVKNLAQVNRVEQATIDWLTNTIDTAIYAAYTVDGTPTTTQQSSAVYALVAQIAAELNNETLYAQAMDKVWQWQISDTDSELVGALGDEQTQTVIAYDQVQTLVAYAYGYANKYEGGNSK